MSVIAKVGTFKVLFTIAALYVTLPVYAVVLDRDAKVNEMAPIIIVNDT
jgi:hypothetical protein